MKTRGIRTVQVECAFVYEPLVSPSSREDAEVVRTSTGKLRKRDKFGGEEDLPGTLG